MNNVSIFIAVTLLVVIGMVCVYYAVSIKLLQRRRIDKLYLQLLRHDPVVRSGSTPRHSRSPTQSLSCITLGYRSRY